MSSPVIPTLEDWHGSAQLHPYFVCDVFTSGPLQGNQLGVFVDGRPVFGRMQQPIRECEPYERERELFDARSRR